MANGIMQLLILLRLRAECGEFQHVTFTTGLSQYLGVSHLILVMMIVMTFTQDQSKYGKFYILE